MARDDYFVIVYQVLKYLYDCLKEGKAPKKEYFEIAPEFLNERYWGYIIKNMVNQGFISGVTVKETKDGVLIYFKAPQITPEGIAYLFDNNLMAKAKEALKGLSDIVTIFPI